MAHVWAAGTSPDTVRPYSMRDRTRPAIPQRAFSAPFAIAQTTSAITTKLAR